MATPQPIQDTVVDIVQAATNSVANFFKTDKWFNHSCRDRVKLPESLIREVYESIDMEQVKSQLKGKLESRMADAIFNSLATEIANDTKKVMSNNELREDCRAVIRQKIRAMEGVKDE